MTDQDREADRENEEIVRGFLGSFGPGLDAMLASAERYCHRDLTWVSVHYPEPIHPLSAFLDDLRKANAEAGATGIEFVVTALAVSGDTVLTERVDKVYDGEGRFTGHLECMGVFRIRDGKIVYGRDYFFDVNQFYRAWVNPDEQPR